ncbi:MAG: methyltransferase [Candidatus Cloacimonetes bacterium 4572_55]|nr:MAG: methyltransferase [Candidatus Cloacimonetes bacterium 4572_55]
MEEQNPYEKFYLVTRRIPFGKVATYGQIAALAGFPGHARQVGYALFRLANSGTPWHRVINAKGEVSYSTIRMGSDGLQRKLLEKEGVIFKKSGKVDLKTFQWQPKMLDKAG